MDHALATRINDYLPPSEVMELRPDVIDLRLRNEYHQSRPGDDFALVLYEGRLVIVPSWHPLNQTPKTANASVYGTGAMETLICEPVLDKNGFSSEQDIHAANII